MNEKTYTQAETAKLLGVSAPTIKRWIDKGSIAYIEHASRKRIKHSEVVRLAEFLGVALGR